ncbi:hypothetical protein EHP00_805 [Ecytonucleospora hepatopenaei]|uniref:Uncharacterized protein n=1 Tax=Ecytonucleospora hepatopenaei TaxID=646526 RepID=A0A1W0E7P1_9MICR|nr:hypothetical protein EHP00_805 [Ecytonucleospora hepatopenaei]
MKLSPYNENYLKEHINENDTSIFISELSTKIEETEKAMLEELNTGYLNVINKCSKLELLSNYLHNVQLTNNELFSTTNEIILRSCDVVDEKETIQTYMSRLEEVKHEIQLVSKFINLRFLYSNKNHSLGKEEKTIKISCFETVNNLKQMEQSLTYFKKYNFYMALNQVYREMYTNFMGYLQTQIKEWLYNLDYIEIGKSVKVMDYKRGIFDPLKIHRKDLITTKFLKVYYASKELHIENLIIETINSNRTVEHHGIYKKSDKSTKNKKAVGTLSSMLDATQTESLSKNSNNISNTKNTNTKNNNKINTNTNNLNDTNNSNDNSNKDDFNSNAPVVEERNKNPPNLAKHKKVKDSIDKLDRDFLLHNQILGRNTPEYGNVNEEFFALISNILLSYFLCDFYPQIQTFYDDIFDTLQDLDIKYYNQMAETLLPLKKLVTLLKIDSEKLDLHIEKIACEFFNSHKEESKDIEYLYKFIDDSVAFLNHLTQFNNELDEMLVLKVDKTLNKYFDKFDTTDAEIYSKVRDEILGVLIHLKKKDKFYDRKNYEVENQLYLAEERFINIKAGTILENKNINSVVKELVGLKNFMDETTQRKIIKKINLELSSYYKGDDLILFKDTLKRNFGDLGGINLEK